MIVVVSAGGLDLSSFLCIYDPSGHKGVCLTILEVAGRKLLDVQLKLMQ